MIELGSFDAGAVPGHYDLLSPFYRAFWGDHIHHGYWEQPADPPARAQRRLVERLVGFAGVQRNADVLDVGCGIGGSALWLARNRNCAVLGITHSPVQARMARRSAVRARLDGRVRFKIANADRLRLPPNSFDAVWVVECSEHLENKPAFFESCYRVLRPGGVLALCAWLAADDLASPERRILVQRICHAMLCPSLDLAAK